MAAEEGSDIEWEVHEVICALWLTKGPEDMLGHPLEICFAKVLVSEGY